MRLDTTRSKHTKVSKQTKGVKSDMGFPREARNGTLKARILLVRNWLAALGVFPGTFVRALRTLPLAMRDYRELKRQNSQLGVPHRLHFTQPCLGERFAFSGTASGHYFHQDLLVARQIFRRSPRRHVDVGSRVDGFVAHVASFRIIEIFDIRPLRTNAENIVFKQCDLMRPQPELLECCDSLSCLHALEHFGLGRYGDRVDINGHVHGLNNLCELLEKKGILYLSVPIGAEGIDFNSNRVFSISTVLEMVGDRFDLIRFSYVDDRGDIHENTALDDWKIRNSCGCHYGCGIFELKKMK